MKFIVAVALCLLACSPGQSALAPSLPTPAGTTSPTATATATPTATVSAVRTSAAATPRPPAATGAPVAAPSAAPSAAPAPTAVAAQRCAPLSGGDRTANRVLSDVRAARQQGGYDRVVFDFGPGALPPYAIEQVDRVIQGGSGFVKPVQGTVFFVVRFIQAGGMGEYRGPTEVRPDTHNVREVVLSTNFEGVLEFGAGLARHSCPRVSVLASPARVVLDFD